MKQNFSQQLRRQKCFIISVLFQRPRVWNKLFYLLHSIIHSAVSLNSGWWLAACDWLMSPLRHDTIRKSRINWGGVLACVERTAQGKLWIILTVKIWKLDIPYRVSLKGNFRRFVIAAELCRPKVAMSGYFVINFCIKKRPLVVKS